MGFRTREGETLASLRAFFVFPKESLKLELSPLQLWNILSQYSTLTEEP